MSIVDHTLNSLRAGFGQRSGSQCLGCCGWARDGNQLPLHLDPVSIPLFGIFCIFVAMEAPQEQLKPQNPESEEETDSSCEGPCVRHSVLALELSL